jgi:uncharacterized protein (DUF427 family)
MSHIRVRHATSGTLLAEGPKGWGITQFEGNLYIRRKHLRTDAFRPNYIPGLCPYKGLYVWLDLRLPGEPVIRSTGWMYWLPNPLFPFIAFRVGLPRSHPDLLVQEFGSDG